MSAEAPRNSGIGEPIPPQKPEGGFSGFFRRLFTAPSELQQTQQPISRIVQPPPGLENFAGKLQQGIADHLVADKQRMQEWQRGVDKLRAEEVEKQAKLEAEQRGQAEQLRIKTEKAIAEGAEVLASLKVAEKLEVIRQTVWEGRGEIRPTRVWFDFPCNDEYAKERDRMWSGQIPNRELGPRPKYDLLGGLELVFKYPDVVWVETRDNGDGGETSTFDYSPSSGVPSQFTGVTSLNIHVLKVHKEAKEDKTILMISSTEPFLRGGRMPKDVTVLVNAEGSETLLDEALTKDSAHRTTCGFIPSLLEEAGRARVDSLKIATGKIQGRR